MSFKPGFNLVVGANNVGKVALRLHPDHRPSLVHIQPHGQLPLPLALGELHSGFLREATKRFRRLQLRKSTNSSYCWNPSKPISLISSRPRPDYRSRCSYGRQSAIFYRNIGKALRHSHTYA
jgi:hypothetical protein